MKKFINFMVAATIVMLLAGVVAAQAPASQTQAPAESDYFLGKWEMTMLNGPGGEDIVSVLTVWRDEGALQATYGENKCSQVELKNENTLTMFFESQNYGVNVEIERVSEDTVKGVAADMFDLTGKRIKDE